MADEKLNRRSIMAAMLIASSLMLALDLTYRALASRLRVPRVTIHISREMQDGLPLQIGDWIGENIPLDETIADKTGTDGYINRRYSRSNGSESVSVYVAYGSNLEGVLGHRPDGCYPSHGWTLEDRESVELALGDGTHLPCRILHFSRGELNRERVTVLHYFLAGGQQSDEVSLFQLRTRRLLSALDCIAQVQIVATREALTDTDSASKLVCTFARDSAGLISRLFSGLHMTGNSGGGS